MTQDHVFRPSRDEGAQFEITPESAGWRDLAFSVVSLTDTTHSARYEDREVAVVPLSGSGQVSVDGTIYALERDSVFTQMPRVVYVPPGHDIEVRSAHGAGGFEFAIGSAPAEGIHPVRVFEPSEMKNEMRGGGAAYRQICHILAPPIPAERLILYEVYVPRGTWSGWAPHCHDGYDGSPYLEEVYWFKLDPANGFAMHRNWRVDEPFDEILLCHDGDAALVTKGYHSSVACPGSNMYFLNYLAGDLYDTERTTPPCFHDAYTWIDQAWANGDEGAWNLPVVGP